MCHFLKYLLAECMSNQVTLGFKQIITKVAKGVSRFIITPFIMFSIVFIIFSVCLIMLEQMLKVLRDPAWLLVCFRHAKAVKQPNSAGENFHEIF